jgi:NAD(P)H-nitrite reductase large subunit
MDKHKPYDYVIVGAGIAGIRAAETIRDSDSSRSILVLSSEDRLPYKRTKIDKHLHCGFSRDQFTLHQHSWYDEHCVELKQNSRVVSLLPAQKKVLLEGGTTYHYGKLLLSTGAEQIIPEELKARPELYCVVRSIKEAEAVMDLISSASHVTIVGGGVQGVEMADQVLKAGKHTTLIHRGSALLDKQFPLTYGEDIAEKLMQAGADIRFQSQITGVCRLTDGHIHVHTQNHLFKTDLILLSIGVRPCTGLAENAGIRTNNGIIVNENFETSIKDIYAAGDNARMEDGYSTELWHAAEYQGMLAGHSMTGTPLPFDSKRFRLKCEIQKSYYFSHNYGRSRKLKQQSFSSGDVHQTWFVESDRVQGVVMKNDKTRAKLYQAAVSEGWTMERVKEELCL